MADQRTNMSRRFSKVTQRHANLLSCFGTLAQRAEVIVVVWKQIVLVQHVLEITLVRTKHKREA